MDIMATASAYLASLTEALNQHNKLKNDLKAQRMSRQGLLQEAARLQQPTTEAISKSADRTVEAVEKAVAHGQATKALTPAVPQSTDELVPLQFTSSKSSYSLIKTGEVVSNPSKDIELDIWRFNSSSKSNIGKWVLFSKLGQEYIWDYKYESEPITLTEGLKEILFNDAQNQSVITAEDVAKWKALVSKSGLGSKYKDTIAYRRLTQIGEGLTETVIIPSSIEELCKELELQLQAHAAGHKGTFSKVNGILKQLLTQKVINSKVFRKILRYYYHV